MGRIAVCQRHGHKAKGLSHYPEALTYPGLEFECGGSLVPPETRPRVRYFYPRSSRKSGGARITVYGENFGLNGDSFIRIAGKKASNCHIPKAEHCINTILDFDEAGVDCGGQNCPPCTYEVAHCSNGIMDYDEDREDCGGKDCELCAPMTLAAHCTNGFRDEDETGIDRGGEDCMPNFCFDARIQGDKRNRALNCGGSCPPCFPQTKFNVQAESTPELVICDAPGDLGLKEAQVSFTRVDSQTLQETSSCFSDDVAARGFVFEGFHNVWSLQMASLDTKSESDVNVTAIAIDELTGDSYVTASVTRVFSTGDGKITLRGKQLYKNGFHEKSSDTDKKDDFSLPNDGSGNPVSDLIVHTVLLKVDIYGIPQWLTYMESQSSMIANDILVDTSARPTRILIAGIFKGYYPRFYQVNPLTKRAKRGKATEKGGGIRCSDMSKVSNVEDCWYFQGDPNFSVPHGSGVVEVEKPGIFIINYNTHGIATAYKGGIYFRSTGTSYPVAGTVRIATHTSARKTNTKNNSDTYNTDQTSSFVDDYNGLYLSAKILVSRYKDIMYFGDQTVGYSRVGPNWGCTKGKLPNGTKVLLFFV
jgi:hypothetical protein